MGGGLRSRAWPAALILIGGFLIAQAGDTCNCCSGGNGVGCDCPPCEQIVCEDFDDFCCDVLWDGLCDSIAENECNCCTQSCEADLDDDGDGVTNGSDNCPDTPNSDQADGEGDGIGDACDPCPADLINDDDNDGLCGPVDNCPFDFNPAQADGDGDGAGNACDNCPGPNPDQADADGDGIGDLCDECPDDPLDDPDEDDVCAGVDNCPRTPNPDQANSDGDDRGDVCDPCPLDPTDDSDGNGICGIGGFTYMTGPFCNLEELEIPLDDPVGVTNNIEIDSAGTITDIDIAIQIQHTWVGDVIATVSNGTVTSKIIDKPLAQYHPYEGCSGDNIDALLDDSATQSVNDECNPGVLPTIRGSFQPNPDLLEAFIGQPCSGLYSMNVVDDVPFDTGTLLGWCLIFEGCDEPEQEEEEPVPATGPWGLVALIALAGLASAAYRARMRRS